MAPGSDYNIYAHYDPTAYDQYIPKVNIWDAVNGADEWLWEICYINPGPAHPIKALENSLGWHFRTTDTLGSSKLSFDKFEFSCCDNI